jgi:hypothetical protein
MLHFRMPGNFRPNRFKVIVGTVSSRPVLASIAFKTPKSKPLDLLPPGFSFQTSNAETIDSIVPKRAG